MFRGIFDPLVNLVQFSSKISMPYDSNNQPRGAELIFDDSYNVRAISNLVFERRNQEAYYEEDDEDEPRHDAEILQFVKEEIY